MYYVLFIVVKAAHPQNLCPSGAHGSVLSHVVGVAHPALYKGGGGASRPAERMLDLLGQRQWLKLSHTFLVIPLKTHAHTHTQV